jgi:hypothetical protein
MMLCGPVPSALEEEQLCAKLDCGREEEPSSSSAGGSRRPRKCAVLARAGDWVAAPGAMFFAFIQVAAVLTFREVAATASRCATGLQDSEKHQ